MAHPKVACRPQSPCRNDVPLSIFITLKACGCGFIAVICVPFPLYSRVCMSPHPTLMIILISIVSHRRPWFYSWDGKIPRRRDRLHTPVFLGFLCGSAGKESACSADLDSIPGLGRSPGEGKGYPPQYSDVEKSMDCVYSPWRRKESDTTEPLSISLLPTGSLLGWMNDLMSRGNQRVRNKVLIECVLCASQCSVIGHNSSNPCNYLKR